MSQLQYWVWLSMRFGVRRRTATAAETAAASRTPSDPSCTRAGSTSASSETGSTAKGAELASAALAGDGNEFPAVAVARVGEAVTATRGVTAVGASDPGF